MRREFLELLDALEGFAARESRADWREHFALMEAPHEEKLLNPGCIAEAHTPVEDGGSTTYRFADDGVKIRDEDGVSVQDLDSGEVTQATVQTIDVASKTITLTGTDLPKRAFIHCEPLRVNEAHAKAIQLVRAAPAKFPHIKAILERQPSAKLGTAKGDLVPQIIQAVRDLKGGFLAIQGPPGTGKTYTGARVIVDLLAAGKRVAVMAQSHAAVNELCQAAADVARDKDFAFVGYRQVSKERDRIGDPFFHDDVGDRLPRKPRPGELCGGTSWQFTRFPPDSFDVIVFDEAGQLSLATAVAAAACARNVILLGDHQQLPQVTRAAHPGQSGVSVMQYLLGESRTVPKGFGFLLDTTYRMNDDITALISRMCYDGELSSKAKANAEPLALSADPDDPLGPCGVAFVEVDHRGNEQASDEEVETVKGFVHRLLAAKVPHDEILVVTPFRAQENALRAALPRGTRVGTVDRIQGQEADVVIYSMATSEPEAHSRDVDFVLSVNRLNVALSRARKKAVLVCSPKLLAAKPSTVERVRLLNALCMTRLYARELKEKARVPRGA